MRAYARKNATVTSEDSLFVPRIRACRGTTNFAPCPRLFVLRIACINLACFDGCKLIQAITQKTPKKIKKRKEPKEKTMRVV